MTDSNKPRQTIHKETLSPQNVQIRIQKAQTPNPKPPANSSKVNSDQKK
jgi:hypothetical protein